MSLNPGGSIILLTNSHQKSLQDIHYINLTIGYDLKNFTEINITNNCEIKVETTTNGEKQFREFIQFNNLVKESNFCIFIFNDELTILCNKINVLSLNILDLHKYCAVSMKTTAEGLKTKILKLNVFNFDPEIIIQNNSSIINQTPKDSLPLATSQTPHQNLMYMLKDISKDIKILKYSVDFLFWAMNLIMILLFQKCLKF